MSRLDEHLAQEAWRDWDGKLDLLPIAEGDTVLDLGCGPGTVSGRLAARCRRVVGLDRDAALLEAARRRCPSNCEFLEVDLAKLTSAPDLGPAEGLWSSFATAHFPDLAPVLESWVSPLVPGGWVALVEVDDLLSGHGPLPDSIRDDLKTFARHSRLRGSYDFRMGRRLADYCRRAGLDVISECTWGDPELAFDGRAGPEVLTAWRKRFDRMGGMKDYFGARRFAEIADTFLCALGSPDHRCTARVVMVLARWASRH